MSIEEGWLFADGPAPPDGAVTRMMMRTLGFTRTGDWREASDGQPGKWAVPVLADTEFERPTGPQTIVGPGVADLVRKERKR